MRRSDFEFPLPEELIAQRPLPQRSASRLLVLGETTVDSRFSDLSQWLHPHDLLVFNDTRVLPARLELRRATGGRVEMFLERPLAACSALVHLRASNVLRAGESLASSGGPVLLCAQRADLWEVQLPEAAVDFFEHHGAVPLPPYIARPPDERDRERYQSVLARVPGAVAAPTASLHFDPPLLDELAALGVRRAMLTLHVGAGTFQPVRFENLDDHVMHAERYEINPGINEAIRQARAAGGRVIAVGTTVARALESAALAAPVANELPIGAAETTLFIRPGILLSRHRRLTD